MTIIITGNFQQQDEAQQATAIRILRAHGATGIERPEGMRSCLAGVADKYDSQQRRL